MRDVRLTLGAYEQLLWQASEGEMGVNIKQPKTIQRTTFGLLE
jgi:hypothetical protein